MRFLSSFRNRPRIAFYLRALSYFRADLPRLLLLLALIGVSTLVGLLQVWPMAVLVDSVLAPTPQPGRIYNALLVSWTDNRVAHVVALALMVLGLRLMQEVLNACRSLLNLRISNNGLLRIRCELFQKLQALHLHYHRSQPQGDSIYRLCNDTLGCQTILHVFVEVAVAATTLAIMLAIMLTRSVELTLIALGIAPLLLLVNVWYGRVLKDRSQFATEVDSRFTSTVQQALTSIGLVQAFGREPVEYQRFHDAVGHSNAAWFRFHWQAGCYRLWVGVIFGVGAALIFIYGGALVHRDQFVNPRPGGMTLGDLMVFLTYLGMFYDPLCKLSGASANVQGGVVRAERVFEVLDRDTVVHDSPQAVRLPRQPRVLKLQNASFAYHPGNDVLREVSVTVKPGQMVAFVGASGVGKSTLLNLLPRFFDPTAGTIKLDGYDLRNVKLSDLRRHIALVWQDSLMLPTSIAENIAYGRLDASDAQIRQAAELAGAAPFIESLPDGYETLLTEGGQNLSGGQRQRLAIARALVTEAPIIVLDEPTSALDPHHEQLITKTLDALKRKRTIVLVSHRLTTVVNCDRIFVMQDGRIVEQGAHRQLMAKHGAYYELARHQFEHGASHQRKPSRRPVPNR